MKKIKLIMIKTKKYVNYTNHKLAFIHERV